LEVFALHYKKEALECLGNIQQKKLFNKQCEWRAGLFTHPTLETTYDFMHWEHNVLNCPFIDPISQDDIDLYIQFLENYLGENLAFLASWQDYDTYNTSHLTVTRAMNPVEREQEESDEEEDEDYYEDEEEDEDVEDEIGALMPPWYRFYDTYRGAGNYLLLPDLRKEKERFYHGIGYREELEYWRKKLEKKPLDTRHHLSLYGEENLVQFINSCEKDKKEVLEAYKTYLDMHHDPFKPHELDGVDDAIYYLRDCYESFPIAEGIKDWKEALIATAKQWQRTQTIRMMPSVFDEYTFRQECGIQQEIHNQTQEKTYREMADKYKANILRGRVLSGEPCDLNF